MVKAYEKQDSVVAQLNNDLRTVLIPPVPTSRATVNTGASWRHLHADFVREDFVLICRAELQNT